MRGFPAARPSGWRAETYRATDGHMALATARCPAQPWRWVVAILWGVLGVVCAGAGGAAQTATAKPRLPPGVDPGGVAIGLITTGIDYTHPEIARCLARDGEGELIGWDVVDGDRLPFRTGAAAGANDDALLALVPCGRVRIVPVRVDPADGASLGKALAFLAASPARAVVLPVASQPGDWTAFMQAAAQYTDLLVIAAAGDELRDLDRVQSVSGAALIANGVVVSAALAGDPRDTIIGAAGSASIVIMVEMAAASAGRSPTSDAAMLGAVTLACADIVAGPRALSGADRKAAFMLMAQFEAKLPGYALLRPACR